MQVKKIVAVTCCRSEYDILYSFLRELHESDSFELSVIVAGAHLSENYGNTVLEVVEDGFPIAGTIHNLINSDKKVGKAKSAGILLTELSEKLNFMNPDFVVVAGDREETVTTAISCIYLEIPLIHIAGGDRTFPGEFSGDVDEPIRHATSKMAHIHFTMNEEHSERLIKMGEEPYRICCTGNPALDRFAYISSIGREELCEYFGFSDAEKPLVLVIQHVISSEADDGARQIGTTLDALKEFDINCIVNYPNSDMGSQGMIEIIEHYSDNPCFRIRRNIPRFYFVNLLKEIDILVGNSSLALLEGSFLKIPAINVGIRQKDRLNGGNVVFVDHDKNEIKNIVNRILNDSDYRADIKACTSIYGDGTASKKMVAFLDSLKESRAQLIAKNITY